MDLADKRVEVDIGPGIKFGLFVGIDLIITVRIAKRRCKLRIKRNSIKYLRKKIVF